MSQKLHRQGQIILTLLSVSVFFGALYFQYVVGISPCPLCLMQRACVFCVGVMCIINVWRLDRYSSKITLLIQCFFASCGLFFSVRQIWLQLFAVDQSTMCLPGLDIMIHYLPWKSIVSSLLWGTADCAEETWTFLHLTLADWSCIYFLITLMASAWFFYINSVKHARISL